MTATGAPRFDLVARAQAGDETAWAEIYAQHRATIRNYLHRLFGSMEDAEDFTTDTFVKAWKSITDPESRPHNDPDLPILAFLYRVAMNCWRDEVRHRKLVQFQRWEAYTAEFHPSQVDDSTPEHAVLAAERSEQVQAVLDKMYPVYRELLVLREFHDLSYREIAQRTGRTVGSVKTVLFRARAEFGQIWKLLTGDPREAPMRNNRPTTPDGRLGIAFCSVVQNGRPWRATPYDILTHSQVYLGQFATRDEAVAAVEAWRREQLAGAAA